jgi:hypothetical protein
MVIPKLNIKGKPGRPQHTIKKTPSNFTQKKHNIGYATRVMPHSHDTYSSSFIPPTTRTRTPTPKRQNFEELILNTPTTSTPLTPRGNIFKDVLEANKKNNKEISIVKTFVPDDDDEINKQKRMKLGIKSPEAYFTENVLKSRYTKTIGEKRNLSDMFDANEQLKLDDEWLGKPDDPGGIPHQVQATTTIKRRQPFGRNNRRNRSRSRTRNRTRTRTRSRRRNRTRN